MKYIKKFENYIQNDFEGMFAPKAPEDEAQSVPGFELGTIDPDDDEIFDFGENSGEIKISEAESYKTFLKVVKERNFEETEDEIKINVHKLGQDYCMSIYSPTKHINKFLNDELKGMYISKGLYDIMEKNVEDVNNFTPIEGIIESIKVHYYNNQCDAFFNLKLKGSPYSEDTMCNNIIIIDKLKSEANKYNL